MSARRPVVSLTAGAEATRALLLKWEQECVLTDSQMEVLAQIAHLTSERPFPEDMVSDFRDEGRSEGMRVEKEEDLSNLELSHLSFDLFTSPLDLLTLPSSSSDFTLPEETKYRPYIEYLSELQDCLDRSEVTEERMDVTKEHLKWIEQEYGEVSKKTSELYSLCEGLMSEERHLKMFGEEMRESLRYWEMLEKLSRQLHSPSLTAENEHFGEILKNIEEGIEYFAKHPRIRDGEVYRMKFKQLQSRALFLVRNYVIAFFKHIESLQHQVQLPPTSTLQPPSTQAKPEIPSTNPTASSIVSFAELEQSISIKNAQFKQISPKIQHLVHQIESRASTREYALLLNDIVNAYFLLRRNTLQNYIQIQIQQLVKDKDMFAMVREGMLFFVRLCENEFQHCSSIFQSTLVDPQSAQKSEASALTGQKQISSNFGPMSLTADSSAPLLALIQLRNWLESFFSLLNDHLRPIILRTKDINLLCSLIDILQYETMDSFIDKNSNELEALRPIVTRLLEDIRERLIFVSNIFIRDEIADFMPSENDLNYPTVLQQGRLAENGEKLKSPDSGVASPPETGIVVDTGIVNDGVPYEEPTKHRGWYPTLEKTIQMLARLYVAIDVQSFSSIAQDAVMTCFQTLCSASKRIEARAGKEDAQLFLIKSLTTLQENIVPFEIDFFVKETNLDFGHTRDLLRRIFSGEVSLSSLFALSSNNALYAILQSAAPRITHSERDVSQAMQDILKSTIEAYIYSATNLATIKVLPFLYQARLFVKSQMEAGQGSGEAGNKFEKTPKNDQIFGEILGHSPLANDPSFTAHHRDILSMLSKQPFATPEAVKMLLSDALTHLQTTMPLIVSKLQLYLRSPSNPENESNELRALGDASGETFQNQSVQTRLPDLLPPSSLLQQNEPMHSSHQETIFNSISDNIVETFENLVSLLTLPHVAHLTTTIDDPSSSSTSSMPNPYPDQCLSLLSEQLNPATLRRFLLDQFLGNQVN